MIIEINFPRLHPSFNRNNEFLSKKVSQVEVWAMHAELRESPGAILVAFSIILQEHVAMLWRESGKVLQYLYQNSILLKNLFHFYNLN